MTAGATARGGERQRGEAWAIRVPIVTGCWRYLLSIYLVASLASCRVVCRVVHERVR
jgi:hypothetical protein